MSTPRVVTWSDREALVIVDGERVRIRRTATADRWLCDEHGDRTELGHCAHTEAVAHAPADPSKYR